MPKISEQQLDAEVLFQLKQHRGRNNPIGRWQLVAKIYGPEAMHPQNDDNMADRQIRESVERLRKSGALICDMADVPVLYKPFLASEVLSLIRGRVFQTRAAVN